MKAKQAAVTRATNELARAEAKPATEASHAKVDQVHDEKKLEVNPTGPAMNPPTVKSARKIKLQQELTQFLGR